MSLAEIHELIDCASRHGFPVRVWAEHVPYDGWVSEGESPDSLAICFGAHRFEFEWGELERATFYTPLAERLSANGITENLQDSGL